MSESGDDFVNGEEAADWLIRGALPVFLELCGLDQDAEWFRHLEPYQGHTRSGRLKGWRGVGGRILAVEGLLKAPYLRVMNPPPSSGEVPAETDAEVGVREAAVFARKVLLPSRIGWDAYRVIGQIHRFAVAAGLSHGVADFADDIEHAWWMAWVSLSDRAVVGALARGGVS